MLSLTSNLERDALDTLIKITLDNSESIDVDDFYVEERVLHLQQKIDSIIQADNKEILSKKTFYKTPWFYMAATLAAFCMFGYWVYTQQFGGPSNSSGSFAYDAMPGTDKAVVSIDGVEYKLSSEKKNIVFSKDSLFYGDGTPILATRKSETLKIRTPYGGQYQLTLDDGTQVWLNAGSELIYTSDFGKKERTVSIRGEMYFDVAENKEIPFYVKSEYQKIKVLGTAFNVKAYPEDRSVTTTLERGSLQINSNKQTHLLKPNQQLIVDTKTQKSEMRPVEVNDVISWKEGVFNLQGLSLEECMMLISRWYNIEVYYDGPIPEITMGGKMGRGVRLSTFLHFLQDNFEISAEMQSDKKLIIKSI